MSQKKFWADRRKETMHRFVVEGEIRQLDCPIAETKPAMGSQMDPSVSQRREELVSGSIQASPQGGPTCERGLRTFGRPNPYSAQEPKKPAGILWSGSDLQRVARSESPPLAFHSDHSSDPGPSQASDPQAPGSVSEGPDPALGHGQKTERRPPDRLHRRALPGFSASRGHLEPQGYGHRLCLWNRGARPEGPARSGVSDEGLATPWDSKISANGQRYEPDRRPDASPKYRATGPVLSGLSGNPRLHPRAASRLQCPGRALQWDLAGEGLAAVSIPDPGGTAQALASLSGSLQRLLEAKVDPSGKKRSHQGPSAIPAPAYPLDSPLAALSRSDLVYTENR